MHTLPTLNDNGLVSDYNIQMETIFKYFITTQKSQSTIYSDHIESYDYLMKMYNGKPNILKDKMVSALTNMYSRYFVEVEVNIEFIDDFMNIDIGTIDSDGNRHNLSSNTTNNIISRLDDIIKLYE